MSLVEQSSQRKDVPQITIGDLVDVHQRILEGQKERIQVFSGTVISRRGEGMREMFTVRRIVQGEGVERIFPINSPKIAKIEVKRTGRVRRAKLYYLRKRVGKATRLREREDKETKAAAVAWLRWAPARWKSGGQIPGRPLAELIQESRTGAKVKPPSSFRRDVRSVLVPETSGP